MTSGVSQISLREKYEQSFREAYKSLNEKQKLAVDQIEGPVMVIAGPGTGKTQLLGVRIGNILQKTDANPSNILCLTYTDAGTIAMRKRLLKFIGPEAYNVNVFTFHAFCNVVIRENIEYFGGYRDLQLASDLELIDIFREIIDGFGNDHPLKRFKGKVYYDIPRLKNLFGTMKQENWSIVDIENAVEKLKKEIPFDPNFQYKRKYTDKKTGETFQKGDPNPGKIATELAKYEKLQVAAQELDNYKKILERKERFDYNDMIQWVIEAFENHPDLKAKYQERYQYILVDEYQDTNGSQNELLFLLSDFWSQPNLFVVGDDDQSIFRFQGANMLNINAFRQKYSPVEIVMDDNYRSSQTILDKSKLLIGHNQERLAQKSLRESRKSGISVTPSIKAYHNITHESLGIAQQIIQLHQQNINLNEIAVIYRKHSNVSDLVKYLELQNIPLNIKKRINVLHLPETKRLIDLLRYTQGEYSEMYSQEEVLFRILHFEYFDISPRDIGKISLYINKKLGNHDIEGKLYWRDVIADSDTLTQIGINNKEKILDLSSLLEDWMSSLANMTTQSFFELILTTGQVIETAMNAANSTWRLQVINTFFDFIKNESAKQDDLSIQNILDMIDKMNENNLELPLTKIVYADQGVNFVTVHSSKGLEFDHVYMIRCEAQNWSSNKLGMMNFSFPNTLIPVSDQGNIEDDRRLFYVAMTRAKNYLHISYPNANDDDKEMEPSRFITEIVEEEAEIKHTHLPDDQILKYKADLMKYQTGTVQLIDHNLIDKVLETFKVSVTSLNKYLRCPLSFYFENILRVPMARNANMGFGNVIHFALEKYFEKIEPHSNAIPPLSELLQYVDRGMEKYHSHFTKKEQIDLKTLAHQIMTNYYESYHQSWTLPKQYDLEYKIDLTEYKGVPITGALDKVAIYDDHVEVTDYKTGKYKSQKLKPPLSETDNGGDYWRQIVFYKILLNGDPRQNWNMTKGTMDFVEPQQDKLVQKSVEVGELEISIVEKQLIDTYQKIRNHEFSQGCGEEDCKWCDFVNNNFVLNPQMGEYYEDDQDG